MLSRLYPFIRFPRRLFHTLLPRQRFPASPKKQHHPAATVIRIGSKVKQFRSFRREHAYPVAARRRAMNQRILPAERFGSSSSLPLPIDRRVAKKSALHRKYWSSCSPSTDRIAQENKVASFPIELCWQNRLLQPSRPLTKET